MLFGGAATYGVIGAGVVENSVDNVETNKYILNSENDDEVVFSFDEAENIRMELEGVENDEAVLNGYESGEMYQDLLTEDYYDTDEVFEGALDELPNFEVTRVEETDQREGIMLEFDEVLEGEYI